MHIEGLHSPILDTRGERRLRIGLETILDSHVGFLPFNSALCRASWRKDRLYALVSASGGPTVGVAVTTPRQLASKQFRVNFVTQAAKVAPELHEGYLQVELLDAEGNLIEGFDWLGVDSSKKHIPRPRSVRCGTARHLRNW